MTDLFRAVQEKLRTYKQRGVDLTHPMGVVVFDKTYPVKEKGLFLRETSSSDLSTTISKDFNAHHIIPLESGLVAKGWAAVGENGTYLEHHLLKPIIDTSDSNAWGRYGYMIHRGHQFHDVNDSNGIYFRPREQQAFHESMKEWSLEPTHGWKDYKYDMSSQEHREHQQNVRSSLITHPSKITVVVFRRNPSRPKNHESYDSYQYDLGTEALTPWSWREKYPNDTGFGDDYPD
jgi:hypothetical protein